MKLYCNSICYLKHKIKRIKKQTKCKSFLEKFLTEFFFLSTVLSELMYIIIKYLKKKSTVVLRWQLFRIVCIYPF